MDGRTDTCDSIISMYTIGNYDNDYQATELFILQRHQDISALVTTRILSLIKNEVPLTVF